MYAQLRSGQLADLPQERELVSPAAGIEQLKRLSCSGEACGHGYNRRDSDTARDQDGLCFTWLERKIVRRLGNGKAVADSELMHIGGASGTRLLQAHADQIRPRTRDRCRIAAGIDQRIGSVPAGR